MPRKRSHSAEGRVGAVAAPAAAQGSGGFRREHKQKKLRKTIAQCEAKLAVLADRRAAAATRLLEVAAQIRVLSAEVARRRELLAAAQGTPSTSTTPSPSPAPSPVSLRPTAAASASPSPSLGRTASPAPVPAPVRRFTIGPACAPAAPSPLPPLLALPPAVLRRIAVCCGADARTALARTCRQLAWVVADPAVAARDLTSPPRPYPADAAWAAPLLAPVLPQDPSGSTSSTSSTSSGSAEPQGRRASRRLKRTSSHRQDMGMMLSLNLLPGTSDNSSSSNSSSSSYSARHTTRAHRERKSASGTIAVHAPGSARSSPGDAALASPCDPEPLRPGAPASARSSRAADTTEDDNEDDNDDNDDDDSAVVVDMQDKDEDDDGEDEDEEGGDGNSSLSTSPSPSPLPSPRAERVRLVHDAGAPAAPRCAKLCVVGGAGVGKTALVDCLEQVPFARARARPTAGYAVRTFAAAAARAARFDVLVCDVGGGEQRPALLRALFTGAHAVVLCYAVNARASLAHVLDWVAAMCHALPPGAAQPALFVLGCKADAPREVQLEDVSLLAINTGASFLGECSATRPRSVEDAFTRVATCLNLLLLRESSSSSTSSNSSSVVQNP